jgi:ABC-2 type transport system permease protein
MPIFDQGYQHWEGKLSGHFWRWLTITRQGVRTQLKNRWVRGVMLLSLIPALLLATFMICWGLLEQQANAGVLNTIAQMFNLPNAVRDAPKEFRSPIWTIAYEHYFRVQLFIAFGLVLLVGPGLISKDLRFNAMPLYFSKPLRRIDYFVGKLGVIGVCLGAVAVAPAMFAYLLGVGFSLDLSIVPATLRILAASVGYGLIIVLSAGTLMLAFSALSRNSRYVAILWAGFWLVTGAVGGILSEEVRADWCGIIAYPQNLARVGNAFLNTESAYQKMTPVTQLMDAGAPPRGPARGARGPRRAPPQRSDGRQAEPNPPWYWSAATLAGLFGLSIGILMTRVKSLDRLK